MALLLVAGLWALRTDAPDANSIAAGNNPNAQLADDFPDSNGEATLNTTAVTRSTDRMVAGARTSVLSAADIESQRKGREAIGKSFTGRPGETYTVQNLAAEFASLSQQAKAGDLVAARTLFEGLDNCATAPHTLKRMQKMMDITAASDAKALAQGRSTGSDPVASQALIQERFRRCGGLGEEHLLARREFGQLLADAGDEFARLQYQYWAMPTPEAPEYPARLADVRAQTTRYLDEELARGNSRALRSYASMHTTNLLGVEDAYRRYMYGYAYAQTPGLRSGDIVYFSLAAAESQMTPEQVARAQREGIALFNDCCRGP